MHPSPTLTLAVIDPVGLKAGMDHYDLLLCRGLQQAGAVVRLYSNFENPHKDITVEKVFSNTGVSKLRAIASNFFGHIRVFRKLKKQNHHWIIVHVFRAGFFDLVVFSIARAMGLRLCTIIHDIESLDTHTLPFIRKQVLHRLPHLRIVHNDFCRKELLRQRGNSAVPVAVIPHMHFIGLFDHYRTDKGNAEPTKDSAIAGQIHPRLEEAVKANKKIFLFFGQIKKAKGIEVLLNAIAGSNADFVTVIAGKVRNDHWSNYEALISELEIGSKVIPVIRHISDTERDYLFAISKAVVLPYIHIYQSGVLLMAMSFPRAVIASDLEPNSAIVIHDRNGLLFKSEQAAALAIQIERVVSGEVNTAQLESRAIQDIRENFSPEKTGRLLVSAIMEYQ